MDKRKRNKKRTNQKLAFDSCDEDSDERFAYIAGYTSGGAPYGITWEEWEAEKRENNKTNDLSLVTDHEDLPF